MNEVCLVYPYPWFSERYAVKDVIQFPRAIAETLGLPVKIVRGPITLGEERSGLGRLAIAVALWINTFVVAISVIRRPTRTIFILFNVHLSAALLSAWIRLMKGPGVRIVVKGDVNAQDPVFRTCNGIGNAIRRRVLNAGFGASRAILIGETTAAVGCLTKLLSPAKNPVVLCGNGICGSGNSTAGKLARDVDVLIVSRFRTPEKGPLRYRRWLEQTRIDGSIVLVGDSANTFFSECIVPDRLSVQCYDRLPHDEILVLMARARVFLCLSVAESFNISIVEALSEGAVVVSTPIGVVPDLAHTCPGVVVVDPDSSIDQAVHAALVKSETYTGNGSPQRFSWTSVLVRSGVVELLR